MAWRERPGCNGTEPPSLVSLAVLALCVDRTWDRGDNVYFLLVLVEVYTMNTITINGKVYPQCEVCGLAATYHIEIDNRKFIGIFWHYAAEMWLCDSHMAKYCRAYVINFNRTEKI